MLRILTWNVNSLRVRLPQLIEIIKEYSPDIIGLQELKMTNNIFPYTELKTLGYHPVVNGQPAYNGVCLLSREQPTDIVANNPEYPDDEQKRIITATIAGYRIICAYIPNGQSLDSEKYMYKMQWLQAFKKFIQKEKQRYTQLIVMGDFNIAPTDQDIYDPETWCNKILCSDSERQHLQSILELDLIDSFRCIHPKKEKQYSWWDYRRMAFKRNHGLRIDLILTSRSITVVKSEILTDIRKHARASDHAPVYIDIQKDHEST